MKVLIIAEGKKNSPNLNIALRIANELEKRGIDIYKGFYLTDNNVSLDETKCSKCFPVQDAKVVELLYMRDTTDWFDLSVIRKIIYLILHPKYLFDYLDMIINELDWLKKSAKKIDIICKNEEIDTVIGFAFPYSVARLISKLKVCPKRYVCQLDPYTYNVSLNSLRKDRRLREEKRVFESITGLFTTDLIKKDLILHEPFKTRSEKIIEIEFPMIDAIGPSDNLEEQIKTEDRATVIFFHAGTFYDDLRNPGKLADLFRKLPENYKLCVAGSNSSRIMQYAGDISERIVDLGYISQERVAETVRDVDFLVCYNNLAPNQVPSKLFECINTGMPFINLCQLSNCPTLKYTDGYEMSYTIFTDMMDDAIEGLKAFVDKMKGVRADKQLIIDKYKECSVEYVAGLIEREIKCS